MRLTIDKIALYFVVFFFVALTFLAKDIPFFWDEVYYIGTAFNIYDSDFYAIIPPLEHDRGNFPFYGFYMALWWKIFGKTLAVGHFAILPVLLGVAWEYFSLAKKFISAKWIPLAMLLLVLEPTFSTQSILMGHDVFLLYFFLGSVRAVFYERKILFLIFFSILALHNIKGFPAVFAVGLFYFIAQKKINLKDFIILALPAVLWLVWMFFHHSKTGWYLFTPVNDYGNSPVSFFVFLKRILLSLWQLADFGRVFLLLVIFGCFVLFVRKIISRDAKQFFYLYLISTAVFILFFSAVDVGLCHRYFMPLFLLANILVCICLANFSVQKIFSSAVSVLLCMCLLAGNFWLYGGGLSNGWDSSLKILQYFGLKDEMDAFVKEKKINSEETGTKFPLYHDRKNTHLEDESFHYTDMKKDSLEKYNYVLLSNVSNQFTVDERKKLNSDWVLVKEFSGGQVYLKLFKNPKTE